jgi:hypothetical protein
MRTVPFSQPRQNNPEVDMYYEAIAGLSRVS